MRSEDVQPLRIPAGGSERGPVAPARRTDELDRRIIEALQANGRESFRAIAARVGVSEATVRARYGRLTARGDPPGRRRHEPTRARLRAGARRRQDLGVARAGGRRDRALARGRLRRRHGRAVRPRRRNGRRRPTSSARADEPAARAAGRRLDGDLHLPRDVEAALRLGEWNAEGGRNEMSITQGATSAEELRRLANDHLWLHFTTHGRLRPADHRARRRLLPRGHPRQALPRRARRAVLRQHRLRLRRGDRPGGARRRCASCPSTRTGRTRTPARSSSRRRSRRWRRATSTASSSSPAARRRSSRRGSSRASTTRHAAEAPSYRRRPGRRDPPRRARRPPPGATRRSRARSPTTARRSALSRSTASRRCARRSSRSCPRCGTSGTRTATTGRTTRRRRSSRRSCSTSSSGRSSRDGARDGLSRAHGAGPERRRLVHRAGGLLARRARDLRPLRHPALAPTR